MHHISRHGDAHISLSFRCMLSQETTELPVSRPLFFFSLETNDVKLVSGANYAA